MFIVVFIKHDFHFWCIQKIAESDYRLPAQAMTDTFVKLKNKSLKYGLIVNVHKTKYMKCTRRQDQLTPINIENKELEQVKSFKIPWVHH
jgi:hypothetical protein